jgi:hypothetical protein
MSGDRVIFVLFTTFNVLRESEPYTGGARLDPVKASSFTAVGFFAGVPRFTSLKLVETLETDLPLESPGSPLHSHDSHLKAVHLYKATIYHLKVIHLWKGLQVFAATSVHYRGFRLLLTQLLPGLDPRPKKANSTED